MQKFGWKRKIGGHVSKSAASAFESEAKEEEDPALENGDVDWLTLMPIKRKNVISLEDSISKAQRLIQEGSVLASSERFWEAMKKWDEALQYTPSDGKIYEMKAQALMELSEVYPAVYSARKAVELIPTWWIAHQTLGRALLGLGEVREAVKCFSRAIHLNPAEKELWEEDLRWAWSLLQKKELLEEELKKEQKGGGAKITNLDEYDENIDNEKCENQQVDIYRNTGKPEIEPDSDTVKGLPDNYVRMRDLQPP